jgi:hypothetical protein
MILARDQFERERLAIAFAREDSGEFGVGGSHEIEQALSRVRMCWRCVSVRVRWCSCHERIVAR